MDNAQEFRSHAFEDFCIAPGISLTYSVPYKHSQNGLAVAFVKKIHLVAMPLLLHAKLSSSMWDHAVLHAATLLKLRPTLLHIQTPPSCSLDDHPTYRTYASLGVGLGSITRTESAYDWAPPPRGHLRRIRLTFDH